MWMRRGVGLALFALLCAIVAYWVMQLRAPTPSIVPSGAPLPPPPMLDASLHARLFGGAVASTNSSIRVTGVVAPSANERPGIALLAVDDKPARAFSTGQAIGPGTVLREVHTDRVVLDQGGARAELSVPQAKPGAGSSQGATPPGQPRALPQVAPQNQNFPPQAQTPPPGAQPGAPQIQR